MAASPSPVGPLIPILLRLYPRDWRARYQDELLAVLAEGALTPSTVLDVALAALDARLSGDYPSVAGDGRKVRRPMTARLAPLAIVLGSAFVTLVAVLLLANGSADWPEGDVIFTVIFTVMPFAVALLALGIGAMAIGRLAGDPVARGLGLLTSGLGLAFAASMIYLFFIDDAGWPILALVIPAFALSSGILGLRLLTHDASWRLRGALLSGGIVAAGAWAAAWAMEQGSARVSVQETASMIELLGFGLLFIGWLVVGLLEIQGRASPAADRAAVA